MERKYSTGCSFMIPCAVARSSVVGLSLALAACGQSTPIDAEQISIQPASLDEAVVSLEQIDRLQQLDPEAAQRVLRQMQPRLDQLNHLIARIEPMPGHIVSFYESEPGVIGISERGPSDGPRILKPGDLAAPISALYRQLASGDEPPAALVAAERREQGRLASTDATGPACDTLTSPPTEVTAARDETVATTQQALTAADGAWWAANACFKSGDFRGCFPNWGGGGFASASAKTSFFQVAPFSGNAVSVRFQYEGSTSFTDPAFPGQWLGWWWHSDSFADCWCSPICACGSFDYNRRSHRWDIINASGDGFHWTHAFKWTCDGVLSCNNSPST
jgi:hypothetical protein